MRAARLPPLPLNQNVLPPARRTLRPPAFQNVKLLTSFSPNPAPLRSLHLPGCHASKTLFPRTLHPADLSPYIYRTSNSRTHLSPHLTPPPGSLATCTGCQTPNPLPSPHSLIPSSSFRMLNSHRSLMVSQMELSKLCSRGRTAASAAAASTSKEAFGAGAGEARRRREREMRGVVPCQVGGAPNCNS